LYSKTPKSWEDADDICKADGGRLVSILDGFEQAYVSLIKTGSVNSEWIGLKSVCFLRVLNKFSKFFFLF
jgi:hypothetical protein